MFRIVLYDYDHRRHLKKLYAFKVENELIKPLAHYDNFFWLHKVANKRLNKNDVPIPVLMPSLNVVKNLKSIFILTSEYSNLNMEEIETALLAIMPIDIPIPEHLDATSRTALISTTYTFYQLMIELQRSYR